MSRLKGQADLSAMKPAESDDERLKLRRRAQAGKFLGTPAYEMLLQWEAHVDARCAEEVVTYTAAQNAELEAEGKDLAAAHGALIGQKILSRDVNFFLTMAKCLKAIPASGDQINVAVDPVLEALTRVPELVGSAPQTIQQLMDYLHSQYGLTPDEREVRKKAPLCVRIRPA